MTPVHLDTCFLIYALQEGTIEDQLLRSWLRARVPVVISSIAWTEFLCGPVTATQANLAAQVLGKPVPLQESDCAVAARLFNETGRRPGSVMDCMIAAMAMGAGARLATVNQRDFNRFAPSGLGLAIP